MAAASAEVEEFLSGPLVSWVSALGLSVKVKRETTNVTLHSTRVWDTSFNASIMNVEVSFLTTCPNTRINLTEYSSLFNGDVLHQVYLQIDPEPSYHITKLNGLEDQALILGRIKNFDAIIKNIKSLYEEELGMTLLVVPECICLGKCPESREGLENMKLLLLLLLGAAVQCPNKELFITRIKELDVDLQHGIVECIRQVIFY
ncbi:Protein Daple [Eumeta japonica]|uniref:Protein Daple n=1 Tax=Eumeta variegata TaxID=151549 RepID=A0A4C1ZSG3_EUMVA|nr:Protein Daple [Eumeta japonica]